MDQKLKEKLSVKSKWVRLLYMTLFLIIACLVKFTVLFITAFQFIAVLFTDHPNNLLLEFGEPLSIYIGQIFRFLSYNTEVKPYPFSSWPAQKTVLTISEPEKTKKEKEFTPPKQKKKVARKKK